MGCKKSVGQCRSFWRYQKRMLTRCSKIRSNTEHLRISLAVLPAWRASCFHFLCFSPWFSWEESSSHRITTKKAKDGIYSWLNIKEDTTNLLMLYLMLTVMKITIAGHQGFYQRYDQLLQQCLTHNTGKGWQQDHDSDLWCGTLGFWTGLCCMSGFTWQFITQEEKLWADLELKL